MTRQSWSSIRDELCKKFSLASGDERISLQRAHGRVLSGPVHAARPLPSADHAVMDGYALGGRSAGAYRIVSPGCLKLHEHETCVISAGEPVPAGTAAVALAHRVVVKAEAVTVPRTFERDNIRRVGEEACKGDVILRTRERIDARHVALAAAAGIPTLTVLRRPSIALLGMHDGSEPLAHLAVMAAALASPAFDVREAGTVRRQALDDELHRLQRRHSLVVVVGESLGDETGVLAKAIEKSGGHVDIRRANLKPAKPIVIGDMHGSIVIGFAGTAYAVTVAAQLFLKPLLWNSLFNERSNPFLTARAAFRHQRSPGRAEALPVTAAWKDSRLTLAPAGRFGQLTALAAMDGFALIEAEAGDIAEGDALTYHPLAMPLI